MTSSAQQTEVMSTLKRTPLHALHLELGGKMVEFAGYEMPVNYRLGVLKEHLHTRAQAGLFDVSHMGQAFVVGPDHEATAAALETLMPGALKGLKLGAMRYSQLLNDSGGIIDDLMITRSVSSDDDGRLLLVVNAARKDVDYRDILDRLPAGIELQPTHDRALLALQGPHAVDALARHCPKAEALTFMTATSAEFDGLDCHVSRSGYTGEDGFEISIDAENAETVARALLAEPEVEAIGLGARDSLRLEAGLCLYGHDVDEDTSPIEANLAWAVGKSRRSEGNFPGAERILSELEEGPARLRVGIVPEGRAPAREGTEIQNEAVETIGRITSGGFGPAVDGPIAMGYVARDYGATGTPIRLLVRGVARPALVVDMPFVPHRYRRAKAA
jgi:aminomethyltransferase